MFHDGYGLLAAKEWGSLGDSRFHGYLWYAMHTMGGVGWKWPHQKVYSSLPNLDSNMRRPRLPVRAGGRKKTLNPNPPCVRNAIYPLANLEIACDNKFPNHVIYGSQRTTLTNLQWAICVYSAIPMMFDTHGKDVNSRKTSGVGGALRNLAIMQALLNVARKC